MRVVFMGTPTFSVGPLQAVLEAGHEVVAVYCQPPRPAGRGQQVRKSAVHDFAERAGLQVRTPKSLKSADEQQAFAALQAVVAVVVAYGLILPKPILDAPKLGCINIHASLLPRWRGAAPIQRAIMAGDAETGITIMKMDEGLDTGPELMTERQPIFPDDTSATLHDRLSAQGAELIARTLAVIGTIKPVPQPQTGATYAAKIDKSEARIDWTRPAAEIDRKIRGLSPFPGAWCEFDGERVKVLNSVVADAVGEPGEYLGDLTVGCGVGAVKITELQKAGKRPSNTAEYLRGNANPRVIS